MKFLLAIGIFLLNCASTVSDEKGKLIAELSNNYNCIVRSNYYVGSVDENIGSLNVVTLISPFDRPNTYTKSSFGSFRAYLFSADPQSLQIIGTMHMILEPESLIQLGVVIFTEDGPFYFRSDSTFPTVHNDDMDKNYYIGTIDGKVYITDDKFIATYDLVWIYFNGNFVCRKFNVSEIF